MTEDETSAGSFVEHKDKKEKRAGSESKGKTPPVEGILFDLLRRISNGITSGNEQLTRIADSLEANTGNVPTKKTIPSPVEKVQTKAKPVVKKSDLFVENRKAFKENVSPELFNALSFDDAKDGVYVDINKFLQTQDFSDLMQITRQLEGEYIAKKGDVKGYIVFKR